MITDFFDQMKSRSKGYASMEYSVSGYRGLRSSSRGRMHVGNVTTMTSFEQSVK